MSGMNRIRSIFYVERIDTFSGESAVYLFSFCCIGD